MIPRPRPEIEQMHAYTPGEQPRAGERVVKLNTNEAPLPPSPRVLEAIQALTADRLRTYPPPTSLPFREAAARHHGLSPQNVIAGNGSDDILTILTRTFVPAGGTVASPWPTYSLYPTLCEIQGACFERVAWRDDWSLPIDSLLATEADAIYLPNPNAPSGTLVPAAELASLASRFEGVLLIDEAYVDFAESDCVGLLRDYENVVVSRTFSKGYALAGLRFGYALAHADVIAQMTKVKDSYNVDALAQVAAVAALEDQEHAEMMWAHVREERERLATELRRMGFTMPPSHANFLLIRRDGEDAGDLYRGLKQQGVLVRHWATPEMRPFLRVTVGTLAENNALLAALATLV